LEGIDWTEFLNSLDDLVAAGQQVFRELFGDLDLTKPEDLEKAIQKVIDTFEKWIDLTTGIVSSLTPFLSAIGDLIGKFSDLDESTVKGAVSIAGWGKAINLVADFVPNLTAPLNLLSGSITLLALTNIPKLAASITNLIPSLTLGTTAIGLFAKGAAAFGLGWTVGSVLRDNIPIVKDFGDWIGEAVYNLVHLGDSSVEAMEKQAAHTAELAKFAVEAARAADAIEEIPQERTVTIDGELTKFFFEIDEVERRLHDVEGYEISVTADTKQAEEALERVSEWNKIILEDGTEIILPLELQTADAIRQAEDARKKIDENLPSEKLMEIQLQGEIDVELQKIKSTAETLQSSFEWQAKIDIADFEAQAKIIEALSGNIADMFSSAGDVISDALGVIADVSPGSSAFYIIRDAIEAEIRQQEKLLELQEELTTAQVEQIKARTEAIKKGKGLVTIRAEGLQAELQMVLQRIVELAQIEANSEGFSALLGI